MRRREFLGAVAAAITTRMQGPVDPYARTAADSARVRAANVEQWMARCREFDARAWKAIEGIAELEKSRPSFAALSESKGLLG